MVKNPPANAGNARDVGLIPGLGRFPGVGNGNLFEYSYLVIPWTEEPGGQHGVPNSPQTTDQHTQMQKKNLPLFLS